MPKDKPDSSERLAIVANLIEVAKADTLYGDLYLLRARVQLQPEMTREALRILMQQGIMLANLPNQIRNAMAQGDWAKVHELSAQHRMLQEQLENRQPTMALAKVIYERHDLFIDPFSPGMHAIAGIPLDRLEHLRDATVNLLRQLSRTDLDWQSFYSRRAEAFSVLTVLPGSDASGGLPAAGLLEEEAASALQAGNFDKLMELAGDLMQAAVERPVAPSVNDSAAVSFTTDKDYFFSFPPEVTRRARELGFGLYRAPSRHQEFAPLCRLAWHPAYAQAERNHSGVVHVPDLDLPAEVPEPLKARMQLFAMHPFVNSAGIRFLPNMVGEDVLVEDFAEPEPGSPLPASGLLELLALTQRDQLNRIQIEAALQEKGFDLLKDELGLDPTEFRLVCIPPDLHLRIGLERGWGQQQVWTHFDGYMIMSDGRQQALAGGDVRFGGIYDLLGVPLNYSSERLIARFAVVQRKRLSH